MLIASGSTSHLSGAFRLRADPDCRSTRSEAEGPLDLPDNAFRRRCKAAFPQSHHRPSQAFERPAHLTVVCSVSGNLCRPVSRISLRLHVAAGTSVPEASVHENYNPLSLEPKVRSTRKFRVSAPAEYVRRAQKSREPHLGRLVPAALDACHVAGPLLGGDEAVGAQSALRKPHRRPFYPPAARICSSGRTRSGAGLPRPTPRGGHAFLQSRQTRGRICPTHVTAVAALLHVEGVHKVCRVDYLPVQRRLLAGPRSR
jgi:hypothetical protein